MLIDPEGSPFTFFGTMLLFLKEKNFQKFQIFFQNVLRFLSFRYGADFRRSRLVLLNSLGFDPTKIWAIFEVNCNKQFLTIISVDKSKFSTRQTLSKTLTCFPKEMI